MKAAVVHGKNDIRYEEVVEPELSNNGSIKVKVRACGICGSDVPRVLEGKAHYFPIVLGHEFAGEVVEIDENVKNIEVGDHVSVAPLIPCFECEDCNNGNYSLCKNYSFIGSRIQGGFAEYVVVPQINVVKIDKNIPFEQAALFEPSTVSLHALKLIDYKENKNVAIVGTGTIAVFTIQWAKILGAKSITVFGRDQKKLDFCKQLGADYIVNINENYKEETKKFTSNKGYDYTFDAVGKENTVKVCLDIAGNRSKICLIGTPTSEMTFSQKEWELINRKEVLLTGSWMSYSYPFPGEEWSKTAECFANGSLIYDPQMIYRSYPLSSVEEAFRDFTETGKVKGRILIKNDN